MRPLAFIQEVKLELQKVRWPNHKETVRLTAMVVLVTAIVAIYSGGLDYLFTSLLQKIVNR